MLIEDKHYSSHSFRYGNYTLSFLHELNSILLCQTESKGSSSNFMQKSWVTLPGLK